MVIGEKPNAKTFFSLRYRMKTGSPPPNQSTILFFRCYTEINVMAIWKIIQN
jgi:hypothetical protein